MRTIYSRIENKNNLLLPFNFLVLGNEKPTPIFYPKNGISNKTCQTTIDRSKVPYLTIILI